MGLFSGGLFGKPNIIPSDLWKRMEDTWGKEFGVNLKKEKVPLSQVAKDFAKDISGWSSTQEIEKLFRELLKDHDLQRIDDRMRREWIILNMLAVTLGLSKSSIDKSITTQLQDDVHYIVYQTEFSSDDERASFETVARQRYASYYDILGDESGDIPFKLGKFFAEKFLDTTDILITLTSSELFFARAKYVKDFVEKISKDFDLEL